MRVAWCLSGSPRIEDGCLSKQLSSFHGATDFDVFVYMWNTHPDGDDGVLGALRQQLSNRARIVKAVFAPEYKPNIPANAITYPETKIENVFRMYCAIERVDALRRDTESEAGERYDLVIRSRSDLFLDVAIDLSRMLLVSEEHLIAPRNGHWRGGLNDQFAIGSSQKMSIYSSVFSRLTTYCASGVIAHPETLLRHHCRV
jgi:hypothetical protein